MNIINISSDIEIAYLQKSFIKEVLFHGDKYRNMLKKDSLYCLSKKIPIFLLSENDMQKHDKESNAPVRTDRYRPDSQEKPRTEWLGFYGRESSGLFEDTRRIVICPERIATCVKNDEEFTFLLAKVIVHEYAHAKMDYGNENRAYKGKDEFWQWMEESMANQLTLKTFENFTKIYQHSSYKSNIWENRLWDFIVNFIKNQPPEYALGYELFDKKIGRWRTWRKYKGKLLKKEYDINKNKWLKYIQTHYNNLEEEKVNKLYDLLFSQPLGHSNITKFKFNKIKRLL